MKPLSKSIMSAFKLIYKKIESCIKECTFFPGIKSFRTILNNQPMTNSIDNLNNCSKATFISCFDFSVFYTTISHDKLVKVLFEIIDFCFKEVDNQFITFRKYSARWVDNEKQESVTFSQSSLKRLWNTYYITTFFNLITKCSDRLLGFLWDQTQHHFLQIFFLLLWK